MPVAHYLGSLRRLPGGLVTQQSVESGEPAYEFFGTTADKGILARGRDLPELFVNAARGLVALMVEDPGAVRAAERRAVCCTAGGPEGLLVAWLSELLYLYEVDGFLAAGATISHLAETELRAEAAGEAFDAARHRVAGHVKAITYHGLHITRDGAGWRAPIIVDV